MSWIIIVLTFVLIASLLLFRPHKPFPPTPTPSPHWLSHRPYSLPTYLLPVSGLDPISRGSSRLWRPHQTPTRPTRSNGKSISGPKGEALLSYHFSYLIAETLLSAS